MDVFLELAFIDGENSIWLKYLIRLILYIEMELGKYFIGKNG